VVVNPTSRKKEFLFALVLDLWKANVNYGYVVY